MSNSPFAKTTSPTEAAAVTTGVQSTVTKAVEAMPEEPIMADAGFLSYGVSQFKVKDKVVKGISTEKGFFYPLSVGEEAVAVLKDYVKRGFAYELKSDS